MNSSVYTLRIARKLAQCENGADRLLADTASLLSEMAIARAECDTFGTGQRALRRVVDAQCALASVQADLMRAHADLLRIGQERGDIMTGDCPPSQGSLEVAA